MNHSLKSAHTTRQTVALRAVIVSALLLSIPACHIPNLRGAKHGNAVPENFNVQSDAEMNEEFSEQSTGQLELHQFFNDPMLTSLIDQAFVDNQELKILAEDIQIARNEVYK